MKFGMNLLLWTDAVDATAFPVFGKIKEIGFDIAELPLFNRETKPAVMRAAGKELDALKLERTAVTTVSEDENLLSPDAAVRKHGVAMLKRMVDLAAEAGCSTLAGPLHSAIGVFTGNGPTEEEWKRSVEALRRVAEHAEKRGVRLAVEPLNRYECYFLTGSQSTRRYIEDIHSPACGVLYDTFHANIEEKNVSDAISSLKGKISHVHISENDRSTPGAGQVKWGKTFAALAKIKYDGPMVIEAFGAQLARITAATKIWRQLFSTQEQLACDGLAFMRKMVKRHF